MEAEKEVVQVDQPDLPANPPAVVEEAEEAEGINSINSATTELPRSITTDSSMPSEGTVSPDDIASAEESVEAEIPVASPNKEVVEGKAEINPEALSTPEPEKNASVSKETEKYEAAIDDADKFRHFLVRHYSRKTKKNEPLSDHELNSLEVEREQLIGNFIDVLRISKKTDKKSVKKHFKKLSKIRNIYNEYLNLFDINIKKSSRKNAPSPSTKTGGKNRKTRKTKASN